MKPFLLVYGFIFLLVFTGCEKDMPLPEEDSSPVARHFPAPAYPLPATPLEKKQAELGRRLFYESLLSKDSSISCASCHIQSAGFSDHGKAVSLGVNGLAGMRNSPSLANLAWNPVFMWDGGVNHIEVMPVAPLTEPVEMNLQLSEVILRLQLNPEYKDYFKAAFGENEITTRQLLVAFARFMSGMISAGSAYDRYVTGEETALTDQEKRGLSLFRKHCQSCHQEPLFTDFSFRNNGMELSYADPGRKRITQLNQDLGKFKVPSLRNVAVSPPYMHDGRFANLEEVLDHYQAPANSSMSDPFIGNGITLTGSERASLLSFLQTLTDHTYLSNTSLGPPGD